jgi:hypothetical protein
MQDLECELNSDPKSDTDLGLCNFDNIFGINLTSGAITCRAGDLTEKFKQIISSSLVLSDLLCLGNIDENILKGHFPLVAQVILLRSKSSCSSQAS